MRWNPAFQIWLYIFLNGTVSSHPNTLISSSSPLIRPRYWRQNWDTWKTKAFSAQSRAHWKVTGKKPEKGVGSQVKHSISTHVKMTLEELAQVIMEGTGRSKICSASWHPNRLWWCSLELEGKSPSSTRELSLFFYIPYWLDVADHIVEYNVLSKNIIDLHCKHH